MQKGLATLEIILAIIIIAVLTKFAVPNVARTLDRAALDYETKRLYSELRFVQSMSRSGTISNAGMNTNKKVTEDIDDRKFALTVDPSGNGYQVFKGTDSNKKALREPHYFANGITISFKSKVTPPAVITFDDSGKSNILSNRLILTSRFRKEKYIIFDSVGRIRAASTDDN